MPPCHVVGFRLARECRLEEPRAVLVGVLRRAVDEPRKVQSDCFAPFFLSDVAEFLPVVACLLADNQAEELAVADPA